MTYYWDPKAGRYRDERGRFVSRATVLAWARQSMEATGSHVDTLSELVSSGVLKPDDWASLFRQEIKEEWLAQYIAGRGGVDQMTPADWGWIGGKLNAQYNRYLARFLEDIKAGKLSPAQIAARARMYILSAEHAYWQANHVAQLAAGYDAVRWVLDPNCENCPDCIAFAGMGWQKTSEDPYGGCFPGSGCTQCLGNCHCILEYGKWDEVK